MDPRDASAVFERDAIKRERNLVNTHNRGYGPAEIPTCGEREPKVAEDPHHIRTGEDNIRVDGHAV